jgi:hypothetical protein
MKLTLGKKIAGVAVAGAVLVGAGTMAWAATSSASTAPTTPASSAAASPAGTSPSAKAAGKGAKLLRRADHGTIEIKVKGATKGTATWETVTFDRGNASAVTASQITVARPDGQTAQLTINAGTTYRGVTSWQQIATGKGVTVVSMNGTATIIQQKVGATTPTTTAPAPVA